MKRFATFRAALRALCSAVAVFAAVSAHAARPTGRAAAEANVSDNWNAILRAGEKAVALEQELPTLPRYAIFSTTQGDQRRKIADCVERARELLLSTDARQMLEGLRRAEARADAARKALAEAREERVVRPDRAEKAERAVAAAGEKLAAAEAECSRLRTAVAAELAEYGLPVGSEAAELFLSQVNAETLIDGTIVAANVSVAAEHLRAMMSESGDVGSAKRYFGMLLVLLDVQAECFETYLEKNDKEWMPGIDAISADARAMLDESLHHASSGEFDSAQRAVFARNAEINRRTLAAASEYREALAAQAETVRGKLASARRVREVARNSYETVKLAGDFLALVRANQADFDALVSMGVPDVVEYDDAGLRQEFLQISRLLKDRK